MENNNNKNDSSFTSGRKKAQKSYSKEKFFFGDILLFSLILDIDIDFTVKRKNRGGKTYMECPRQHDETILICLVILKRIYNSIKKNSISNKDLILIRGESVLCKFYDLEKDIKQYKGKKHPKLFKLPYDYFKSEIVFKTIKEHGEKIYNSLPPKQRKNKWELNENHKAMMWLKDLGGNDFSSYIGKFPFDYYEKYINGLLIICEDDFKKGYTAMTLQAGLKSFLHDIKIDKENGLSYSFIESGFSKSEDSFDRVFYSEQGKKSYRETWNRFLKYYPKEIKGKFFRLIGRSEKKIEKYLSGELENR